MKRRIKYIFSLEFEYDDNLNFDTRKIRKLVPTLLDNLLELPEISEHCCFFGFEFKTLSFDILFVDDVKIQAVNKEYRKKDVPTDVITFALFADDDFKPVLGDDINLGEILISVDTAKRQSADSLDDEILMLICHGILHLFGFDHQTEEDYNFIVDVQKRVLCSVCKK